MQACFLYAQYLYTLSNIQNVTDGILHHVLWMIHSLWSGRSVACEGWEAVEDLAVIGCFFVLS